jgi:hypothetical protein
METQQIKKDLINEMIEENESAIKAKESKRDNDYFDDSDQVIAFNNQIHYHGIMISMLNQKLKQI